MKLTKPSLTIAVPCYNESDVILDSHSKLMKLMEDLISLNIISASSAILYIDDGSKDDTWIKISHFVDVSKYTSALKLSRNVGHQTALWAGMAHSDSDVIISIDADLQDDITAIYAMLRRYSEGYEIVYGVRSARHTDTAFKKSSAHFYYRILEYIGIESVYNHADFRLLSKRAKNALLDFKESNIYIRGMVPLIGFNSTTVEFARAPRLYGETKYTLIKMFSLAWSGISSFSTFPLRVVTFVGFVFSMVSLFFVAWAVYTYFFDKETVPGWPSLFASIFFLSGAQLLFLGIVGEYVGKIFMEVKRRPKYFVETFKRNS